MNLLLVCLMLVCTTENLVQGFIALPVVRNRPISPHNIVDGRNHGTKLSSAFSGTLLKDQGEKTVSGSVDLVITENGCPPGFSSFEDSCYAASELPRTWKEARAICKTVGPGGDLASVNSKKEYDYIRHEFGVEPNGELWIGLRKEGFAKPYTWTDGEKVQYLPWTHNYTGQDQYSYAALSLDSAQFQPKANPKRALNFLCETPRATVKKSAKTGPVRDGLLTGRGTDEDTGSKAMPTQCEEGWEKFNKKCYKAFFDKSTFKNARAKCRQAGSELLSIHSPPEGRFVRTKLLKDSPNEFYWMGLSYDKYGMHWSDGSPFDFSNFAPGKLSAARADMDGTKKTLSSDRTDMDGTKKTLSYARTDGTKKTLSSDRADMDGTKKTLSSDRADMDRTKKTLSSDRADVDGTKKTLSSDRADMDGTKKTLSSDRADIDGTKKTLSSDRADMDGTKKTLSSARTDGTKKTLSSSRTDGAKKTLNSDRTDMDGIKETLSSARTDGAKKTLSSSRTDGTKKTLSSSRTDGAKETLNSDRTDMDETKKTLSSSRTDGAKETLNSDRTDMDESKETLNSARTDGAKEMLNSDRTDMDESKETLNSDMTDMDETKETLSSDRADIDETKETLSSARTDETKETLSSDRADETKELLSSDKTDMDETKKTLNSARTNMDGTKKKLSSARPDMDWMKKMLSSARTDKDGTKKTLNSASADMDWIKRKLSSAKADMDGTKKMLSPARADMEHLEKYFGISSNDIYWTNRDPQNENCYVCSNHGAGPSGVTQMVKKQGDTTTRASTTLGTTKSTSVSDQWIFPRADHHHDRKYELNGLVIKHDVPTVRPQNSSSTNNEENHRNMLKSELVSHPDDEEDVTEYNKSALFVAIVGFMSFLVVTLFGVNIWRRRNGSSPYSWSSLHNANENTSDTHGVERAGHALSLRDSETNHAQRHGAYGTMG